MSKIVSKCDFLVELHKVLTPEKMTVLCYALGITGPGTIEGICKNFYEFSSNLIGRGYLENYAAKLKEAAIKCQYRDIITLCNQWASLDLKDGIETLVPNDPDVEKWCLNNSVPHLYEQLIDLGFNSLERLAVLDEQTCIEMGLKGYHRISFMEKIKQLRRRR